jgi:hypothetical protein
MNEHTDAVIAQKLTYWVRSKQTSGPCGTPAPIRFKTLASAKRRLLRLNLCRGPFHPGYYIEVQDSAPPPFILQPSLRDPRFVTRVN